MERGAISNPSFPGPQSWAEVAFSRHLKKWVLFACFCAIEGETGLDERNLQIKNGNFETIGSIEVSCFILSRAPRFRKPLMMFV